METIKSVLANFLASSFDINVMEKKEQDFFIYIITFVVQLFFEPRAPLKDLNPEFQVIEVVRFCSSLNFWKHFIGHLKELRS